MPLFVVATPIGNLGDLSPRAKTVLGEASVILCEDTRRTRKLLSAVGIPAPTLWSCHAHNEHTRIEAILDRLRGGASVALVTDAGTPAISDPGIPVVRAAHHAQIPVVVVPGPSSVVAAMSAAGIEATWMHFVGFPPRKQGERERWIAEISRLKGAVVMLESGRRVGGLIAALAAQLPQREACLCRELTKLHEEIVLAPLPSLCTDPQQGEVVLVLGPGEAVQEVAAHEQLGEDAGLKTIAGVLAKRWGRSRREAYQALVALERELD